MTTVWRSVGGLTVMKMFRRHGLNLGNYYGAGTGQIWLGQLQCTGSEDSLVRCSHNGWGVHDYDCSHNEHLSILCGNGTSLHAQFQ